LGCVDDMLAIRRPGRIEAEVGDAAYRLSRGSHDEDATAVALRVKGDLLAISREGGLGVVPGRIREQVERLAAGDPLPEEVTPVADFLGIDKEVALWGEGREPLLTRQIGQLGEGCTYGSQPCLVAPPSLEGPVTG